MTPSPVEAEEVSRRITHQMAFLCTLSQDAMTQKAATQTGC
jgi:hypothetical protein